MNFVTGQAIANASFVGAGIVQQHPPSGSARPLTPGTYRQAQTTRATAGRVSVVDKVRRTLGLAGR